MNGIVYLPAMKNVTGNPAAVERQKRTRHSKLKPLPLQ